MDKLKQLILTYPGWLTALIALVVYRLTLAPSVLMIDSGELAAAIAEPGVTHATGYPLFSMLGWLFMQLPLQSWLVATPIQQANLFAAVCTAAGIGVATQVMYLMPQLIYSGLTQVIGIWRVWLVAVAAGLGLAVVPTVWFQGISVEVYGLHLLLFSIITLDLDRAHHFPSQKNWLWVAVALALGFGNHLTTVVLLPAVAWVFFRQNGFGKPSWQLIGLMLAVFIPLLLLLYAYIPLRSSAQPLTNWGHVDDWATFKYHVTGKQYGVFFKGKAVAGKQLKVFGTTMAQVGVVPLLLCLTGLILLLRANWKAAITLLLIFVAGLFWSLGYDIHDIENYFLLQLFIAYILVVFGIHGLSMQLSGRVKLVWVRDLLFSLLVLSTATSVYKNWDKCDYGKDLFFDAYANAILTSAPKDAIIFSKQWDYWVASSFYFQRIEKLRPDVMVVDKELLRRTWYIKCLQEQYPDAFAGIKPEVQDYLLALQDFEQDIKTDAERLERGFRRIIQALTVDPVGKRPVLLTPDIYLDEVQTGQMNFPTNLSLVSNGFGLLVNAPGFAEYVPAPLPTILRGHDLKKTKYHKEGGAILALNMMWRAQYEAQTNHGSVVKDWVALAQELDPTIQVPQDLLPFLKAQ